MLEESPTHWLSGVPSVAPCGHHSSWQSVGWLQKLWMSEVGIKLVLKKTSPKLTTHQAITNWRMGLPTWIREKTHLSLSCLHQPGLKSATEKLKIDPFECRSGPTSFRAQTKEEFQPRPQRRTSTQNADARPDSESRYARTCHCNLVSLQI